MDRINKQLSINSPHLIYHSIQDSDDAGKAATNRNANDACQCHAKHNKEYIKSQKYYTKPALRSHNYLLRFYYDSSNMRK